MSMFSPGNDSSYHANYPRIKRFWEDYGYSKKVVMMFDWELEAVELSFFFFFFLIRVVVSQTANDYSIA